MALQDLTPQLRTRLSRMERAVGWFVILATALLVFGFCYYVYKTAEAKGWFIMKINYRTSISSGEGLKVRDPVMLMGFPVGEITAITPNEPLAHYNITVNFNVRVPHQGYLWSDSRVAIQSDFLGHRYLELTKGQYGLATIDETTNRDLVGVLNEHYVRHRFRALTVTNGMNAVAAWQLLGAEARTNKLLFYTNLTAESVYWLEPEESPSVTEQLNKLIASVEDALPGILNLTNQIATVLSNSTLLTSNLNIVAANARPAVSNLTFLTSQLNQPGALGEWILPTNIAQKLDTVLGGAGTTVATANTNLEDLDQTLIHLADLTSNLNNQVEANTNMLGEISKAVRDADDFVQGLKHHWLLRSAFKTKKTNSPPETPREKER